MCFHNVLLGSLKWKRIGTMSQYMYTNLIEDVVTINNKPLWNLIQHLGMWVPSLQHLAFELCASQWSGVQLCFSNLEQMLWKCLSVDIRILLKAHPYRSIQTNCILWMKNHISFVCSFFAVWKDDIIFKQFPPAGNSMFCENILTLAAPFCSFSSKSLMWEWRFSTKTLQSCFIVAW